MNCTATLAEPGRLRATATPTILLGLPGATRYRQQIAPGAVKKARSRRFRPVLPSTGHRRRSIYRANGASASGPCRARQIGNRPTARADAKYTAKRRQAQVWRIKAIASGGMAPAWMTDPGKPATLPAIQSIACNPRPIGSSATSSRPNGMRSKASSPQGITHKPVRGTAARFASRPYSAKRLK